MKDTTKKPYRYWSEEEDARLRHLRDNEGKTWREIAEELCREKRCVSRRYKSGGGFFVASDKELRAAVRALLKAWGIGRVAKISGVSEKTLENILARSNNTVQSGTAAAIFGALEKLNQKAVA